MTNHDLGHHSEIHQKDNSQLRYTNIARSPEPS